mmetsp:Transcript_12835/g.15512  ORF Transcript_12835/g.15512 Transcript_12835/m.15512 type:complete len:512 (-) Transcript_12835:212-1747(-)|eukprot:CAMPEP_0197845258 /NCGR_PEP_ID=MMETSP1438-20131217/2199_1 /TAXON_ID=1461541 /ORGANISM="Pterosperma sp., Strain CCMP1384" /LENGTH=511 /DNA_ID=CAMNT_0043456461 /DNA_START=159 /DNA_END=1694 /DNA_ORIENTATION=+
MTEPATTVKKACLVVIDGWGVRKEEYGNAILAGETPVMTGLEKDAAYCECAASGLAVGLPEGLMGNSEVGHLAIGAGQAQYQDLVRINLGLKDGSLRTQPALVNAYKAAKEGTGRMHFCGLLSDGGVHSHQEHLYDLLKAAKEHGISNSYVHCFMDGRDTPPTSGEGYLKKLDDVTKEIGYGKISTVVGRYYAMDRDKRWDRVQLAFDVMCRDLGATPVPDMHAELAARYAAGENDEFIKPYVVDADGGIQDGDVVLFFNYRADRMREMCECMGLQCRFKTDFKRDCKVVMFTQYKGDFDLPAVYPPQVMNNVLAEWLSKKGLKQYHCAETEKYAHVTFFFNGGREDPFEGEERQMIPSPKVATYDLQPEMSSSAVADDVAGAIKGGKYEFVLCNFAATDMVGHTGMMDKAVIAVSTTDKAIGVIKDACVEAGYGLFITADHGNAELMLNPDGSTVTSHTNLPVPFIGMDPAGGMKWSKTEDVTVADIAPTILTYMGLDVPSDMKGSNIMA